jgi:hypothetical protein
MKSTRLLNDSEFSSGNYYATTPDSMLNAWITIKMHNAERSCRARLLQDLGEKFLAEIDSADLLDGIPWNWKGFIEKSSFEIVTK